jgi:hypothetical protein
LVRIFHACLATGYVPTAWHQVKVVLYPSLVGIPIAGIRTIDLSALRRSCLRPWKDWWIDISGINVGFFTVASQPTCVPGWEIH